MSVTLRVDRLELCVLHDLLWEKRSRMAAIGDLSEDDEWEMTFAAVKSLLKQCDAKMEL